MDNDLLNYALASGIISEDELRARYEMVKREQYLSEHEKNFSVWYSKNADRWFTYLPDASVPNKRRMIKKKEKKDLDDAIVAFYKTCEDDPTVEEVFYRWIDKRLNEYDDFERQTANKYVNDFNRFISGTEFSRRRVQGLSEIDVVRFIKQFSADRNISVKGRANFMILLKGVFQYAKENGYSSVSMRTIKEDYDIRSHKHDKKHLASGEDVFLENEVQLLKDYIMDHQDDIVLLGILMVIHTGVRVGELATLKWSDFDTEKRILTVSRTEIKYQDEKNHMAIEVRECTKGAAGWRKVFYSEEVENLLNMIRKLNPDGEFLFMKDGERVWANAWTKKLPRLCARLGIGIRVEGTNYVNGKSIHKLRKYYVSRLLDSGVSDSLVKLQVGHTDIRTSEEYYHRNTKGVDEAREELMPVLLTL